MPGEGVMLDRVEGLVLPPEEAAKHGNEMITLRYLGEGLRFLATAIEQIETQLEDQTKRESEDTEKGYIFLFGTPPGYEWIPLGLIACMFHWYAVSACNYVRLVGYLVYGDKAKASRYEKSVLPGLRLWRDKVAAHFAITDPRRDDSAADLAASVMFPIGYEGYSFAAGTMTLGIKGQRSRNDMKWRLTEVHAGLAQRYWPALAAAGSGSSEAGRKT